MNLGNREAFVLDCSVAASWCFEDEITDYTESVLDALKTMKARVPFLWTYEISNVLLIAERTKRISRIKAETFKQQLNKMPIEIDITNLNIINNTLHELARETHLPAYDAAYLELAYREGLPICSLDKALINAAKKLKVKVFSS